MVAKDLWSLTEVDENDNIDATNRIAYRSFLVRHKDMDKEGRYVDFCHRSMREFFVAKGIYNILINDIEKCKTFLKKYDLNNEMLYFISQMIKSSSNKDSYIENLNCFVSETSQFDKGKEINRREYERLGCNSINIIYSTLNYLPNNDYSNLILDGAHLTGTDLSNKNFTETSLRNSNLYNINFENSIFINADLTGALFDKTYKIVSVFYYNNDDNLYVLYEDNSIWKWDINKYTFKKFFKLDTGKPSHIVILPNNCIAFIEQGKTNLISFYKDNLFEGDFKIDNNLKIINICNNNLLLQQDTGNEDKKELKYTTHDIINNKYYSITSKKELFCTPLGVQGILTYSDSELKINNNYYLKSIPNIMCISSYDYGNGFILGLGNKNGKILITRLTKNESDWNIEDLHDLKNLNSNITCLFFIDKNTMIVAEENEKIYILRIMDNLTLSSQSPELKIELLCKGMQIEGLKSEREYKFLNELIDINSKENV